MATGKQQRSIVPKWLRHRNLLASEAVLLVGALQEMVQQRVQSSPVPNWGKVGFTMLVVVGALGGLLLLLQSFAVTGMAKTHTVVKSLPVPLGTLLLHASVLAGLFVLYAQVWHFPVDLPLIGRIGDPRP
jgi:hypothetical protein